MARWGERGEWIEGRVGNVGGREVGANRVREGWSRVVTEERVYELCGARMREELRYPGYR